MPEKVVEHLKLNCALEKSMCSGSWSTSFLLPLTLVSAELFCQFLLLSPAAIVQVFSHFLKYVIPEVLPPLLMGLALATSRSIWEPAGTGSIGHGKILAAFHQSHPCSPHATKTLPHKSITVMSRCGGYAVDPAFGIAVRREGF